MRRGYGWAAICWVELNSNYLLYCEIALFFCQLNPTYWLGVIAIKTVNVFGWGQAVVSYIAMPVLVIVIVAVLTIFMLVVLGSATGNVFENIAGGVTP